MIFFVIDAAAQSWSAQDLLDPTKYTPAYPRHGSPRLVAWNEVVALTPGADPLKGLRDAIWAAAKVDDVCVRTLRSLDDRFGLHPDATTPASWVQTLEQTLLYWAHPRIGNISANWRADPLRPSGDDYYEQAWGRCAFLSDATKAAIQTADDRLPGLTRSARDQVRICYHIVDLARAYVGEVASWLPRRLEKLFAYELALDRSLERELVGLLQLLRQMNTIPRPTRLEHTEYLKYYLFERSAELKAAPDGTFAGIVDALWADACGDPVAANPSELLDRCKAVFDLLPPVVRAAILLNDIRKILLPSLGLQLNVRTAHPADPLTFRLGPTSGELDLRIEASQTSQTGWSMSNHWTRDERHPSTQLARTRLAPIWAGSSGHVAKNIAALRLRLTPPNSYPEDGDRAIAAGMFVLWRLYYDTRYSPTHSLVEVCDGTTDNVSSGNRRFSLHHARAAADAAPLDLFDGAVIGWLGIAPSSEPLTVMAPRSQFIDGLGVLDLLRARYWRDESGLTTDDRVASVEAALQAGATALTGAGYVVIQWSKSLDPARLGTAATRFRPPPARKRKRRKRSAGAVAMTLGGPAGAVAPAGGAAAGAGAPAGGAAAGAGGAAAGAGAPAGGAAAGAGAGAPAGAVAAAGGGTGEVRVTPRLVRAQASSSSSSSAAIPGDDVRWGQIASLTADRARIIAAVVESVAEGWRAERGVAPLPPRPANGPLDPAREAIKVKRWEKAMASGDRKLDRSGTAMVEPPGSPYAGRARVRKVCEPFRVVQAMSAPGGSRNPNTPGGPYSRVEFELTYASPGPIDELFNHPAGMRGHYFHSVAAGDAFTRDLIAGLRPILTTIRDEWAAPSLQDQWLYAPNDFDTALAGGKVWLEPWASSGTLKSRGLGNGRWLNRTVPASRRRAAKAVRQAFIAALLAAEQNDQRAVDDFLRAARGNMPDDYDDDEGLLGPDADSIEGNDWLAQDQGALFMGASPAHVLLIKGEFLAHGNPAPWFPLRKKYNSLSLHWIGYS